LVEREYELGTVAATLQFAKANSATSAHTAATVCTDGSVQSQSLVVPDPDAVDFLLFSCLTYVP